MRKFVLPALILILLSVFLTPQEASAGAWTVPKHKVWSELYIKWSWAKADFDANRLGDNQKGNNARSWEFGMEPKIEFGVTDWLTFLFSTEYKEGHYKEYDRPVAWGPFQRKNNGVTSVKLGGKVRFLKDPVVLSSQIKVFIYPGYGNYNGDDPAYRHQPGIGDGEDALEWRMLAGRKFDLPLYYNDWKVPCYVGTELGYRWKNQDVCNDIVYFIEGGFWPTKWLLIKSEVDGTWNHDGTGSIEKEYAMWRIGMVLQVFGADSSITRKHQQFNVEVQYGKTFFGRNTSDSQEVVLKFATQF